MDVLQEKCEEQKNNGEMCDSESQRTMRNGTKDPSFQSPVFAGYGTINQTPGEAARKLLLNLKQAFLHSRSCEMSTNRTR